MPPTTPPPGLPVLRATVHHGNVRPGATAAEIGRTALDYWLVQRRPAPERVARIVVVVDVSAPACPVLQTFDAAQLPASSLPPAVIAAARGGGSYVVHAGAEVLDAGAITARAYPADQTPRTGAMGFAGACKPN